jgi:uncharacterized protein YjbJ (UPF0337 family)
MVGCVCSIIVVRLSAVDWNNLQDKERLMNEDKLKGKWKQVAGKAKAKWGKLTDDDLKIADGNSEYLAGRVQERYGIAREEAEKQVKEFSSRL